MTIFSAALLGVIEGLTEFLPVSSTGHLILASRLLGLPDSEFVKSFEVAIQLGAIMAVVILYWRQFLVNRQVLARVLVAFGPTAIIGLLAYPLVKEYFLGNEVITLVALFVGGLFLIFYEKKIGEKENSLDLIEGLSWRQAIWIGLAQAVAIIPGVSRSAATIIGGMALGLSRRAIVEFSFLLAVPTMAAA
ncbi:MAG TPA: undecaprenyl-diphosphate phosphatase, partial [Candidatus Paceibacterota bacterium]|nr:undecaprenyl-diphosphate phosphatase [Candidatus Paceibacterota bacterium]